MKKSIFVLSTLLLCGLGFSQAKPEAEPALPGLEIDSTTGKAKLFDYNTDIRGFTHPGLALQSFKGKQLVIFFFSAMCPHCQKAAPLVAATAREQKNQKVSTIAIAVSQNSDAEISQFISSTKFDVPLFHDYKRLVGRDYGNGRVPLALVIYPNGEYRRLPGYEAFTPALIKKAFKLK